MCIKGNAMQDFHARLGFIVAVGFAGVGEFKKSSLRNSLSCLIFSDKPHPPLGFAGISPERPPEHRAQGRFDCRGAGIAGGGIAASKLFHPFKGHPFAAIPLIVGHSPASFAIIPSFPHKTFLMIWMPDKSPDALF
jgi:hypothetical protein